MELNKSIYKSALHVAVKKENIEIIKLLISQPKIDINILKISNQLLEYNFKSINLIKFRINYFNKITNQLF